MVSRMITVGQLKEIIKDLPDDTLIISYKSDMEKCGYQGISDVHSLFMNSEKRDAYDAFDYTPYSYDVFVPTEDGSGTLCLVIN